MDILKNISLKPFNTFGIDVQASSFIKVTSLPQLFDVVAKNPNYFLIGGGSNMLLTKDILKTVVLISIKGISIVKETKNDVYVEANAGEDWHDFVTWCLANDYGGIENLSLIPGSVGASPIQNIGAYGVEVKDVIYKVNALKVSAGKIVSFSNKKCKFGYRDSVFKNEMKDKYIITSVIYKLSKKKHQLNYNYGAIKAELLTRKIQKPTIKDISSIICEIRKAKLPNPDEIGNSGSFFKNPVVNEQVFKRINENYPDMPFYKMDDLYKIPAGWLIEKCEFKGKRFGDAGVHKNQALVLVNYGNATGKEVCELALNIRKKVAKEFGIQLEIEVNIF